VQRQVVLCGVPAELRQSVRRARAHGVGGNANADALGAQSLELTEVLGHRLLAKPRDAAAEVARVEERQLDPGLGRSLGRSAGFVEAEVMELARQRCSRSSGARDRPRRTPVSHPRRSPRRPGRASPRARPRSRRPGRGRAAHAGTRGSGHRRSRESEACARPVSFHCGRAHRLSSACATAERPDDLPSGADPAVCRLHPGLRGGRSWWAGSLFLVAGITDQVDGFLARRWHVESRFAPVRRPARRPVDDRDCSHPRVARRAVSRGLRSPSRCVMSRARGYPDNARARLPVRGEPRRQGRDVGCCSSASVARSSPIPRRSGRCGSSGPASRSRSRRS